MPRAPSEKMAKAEKLFAKGMKLTDIAKKLGVPEGTVRSWKNRGRWTAGSPKKNESSVANNESNGKAALQKKKRGGQPGNKNSVGGPGNPHPTNRTPPDHTKHGAYRAVFMDALDADEQELIKMVPSDEEQLLMEQIQLFSIRERRILNAINANRKTKSDVVISSMNRFEEKRTFDNDSDQKDENEYNRRQREKIDKGEILPGRSYDLQTITTNKDLLIARLEQELSSVQSKKTKAIETLAKLRLERAKLENEKAGNASVDDWIAAVAGEREGGYGDDE